MKIAIKKNLVSPFGWLTVSSALMSIMFLLPGASGCKTEDTARANTHTHNLTRNPKRIEEDPKSLAQCAPMRKENPKQKTIICTVSCLRGRIDEGKRELADECRKRKVARNRKNYIIVPEKM